MAEHYAQEWKREWGGEDKIGFKKEISSIRAPREMHVEEAREWAGNLDLRAGNVRKACLSFPSKTAVDLDQHAFKDIALLPDNALDSLGEIARQCFVKTGNTNPVTCTTFASAGQEIWKGAEPSPSRTPCERRVVDQRVRLLIRGSAQGNSLRTDPHGR